MATNENRHARWVAVVFLALTNVAVMLTPFWQSDFAGHWFAVAIVDYIVLWKMFLRRPLGAFGYIFIISFIYTFTILANLAVGGRLVSTHSITRFYQRVTGSHANGDVLLRTIGFWISGVYGFAVALALGLLALWLERSRGWGIAAFVKGALRGLCVGILFAVLERAIFGPSGVCWTTVEASSFNFKVSVIRVIVLLSGVVGGIIGLKHSQHGHAANGSFGDIR